MKEKHELGKRERTEKCGGKKRNIWLDKSASQTTIGSREPSAARYIHGKHSSLLTTRQNSHW